MNNILGTIITALVTDKNESNVFAQREGVTFKVMDANVEDFEIGDIIEGFAYVNQKDEYVMMIEIPSIYAGIYDWGEVVEVQRDLGVFVDVGWIGKDLAVSLDDLPVFANVWPRKGDRLYLSVRTDSKNRMWGQLAQIDEIIDGAPTGTEEMHNEDVSGTVVASLKAGSYIYLEDGYIGFVHPNERDREPRLGEHVNGRVIGVRDDGVLYTSLLPRAHEALDDDAAMIFTLLKRSPEHRIPYHDKSDPDDIRDYFGISKGQFKRAVGRLMKERLVLQDKEGTYLTENGLEREL
jgi:hypothetical protein